MAKTCLAPSACRSMGVREALVKYKWFYILAFPGIAYLLLFKIAPIWGLLMAFQDYNPFSGFWASEWVGMANFQELVTSREFGWMLRNTFAINLLKLVFFFPAPILLSLMLNEVSHSGYKRLMQSLVYLPHFLSWVVIATLTLFLLSTDFGIVNKIAIQMGYKPTAYLTDKDNFWTIIVAQGIWRETGWGTIIFLASMSGIDMELYEAARIDGAGRMRQIWHVTLPGIRGTIVTLLILRLGQIFDTGFEQIILMSNALVRNVSVVFDTYAYTQGIVRGKISAGVAVGLFKSMVGLIFVVAANKVSKKLGYDGIY